MKTKQPMKHSEDFGQVKHELLNRKLMKLLKIGIMLMVI